MSENKTAADAPQMAKAFAACVKGKCPADCHHCVGGDGISSIGMFERIAALPPAPLPADVVHKLQQLERIHSATVEAIAASPPGSIVVCKCGQPVPVPYGVSPLQYQIAVAKLHLAEAKLAALAQPAAPMTEAEQADEAGKRG